MSLQENCFSNLRLRSMSLQDYIQKMINRETNGLDITMIVLALMLDISIIVLYQKYMWVSEEKDLYNFDVYLILNKGGHVHAAAPKRGYKVCVHIPDECRPLYIDSSPSISQSRCDEKHDGKTL